MRTIYLTLVFLLGASVARAGDGVLVEHVPGGAKQEIVIAVVRQSLINRGWSIETIGEDSVDAAIKHMNNDAKLRITLSKGQLIYSGSSIKTTKTAGTNGNPQPSVRREGDVPTRWIEYLRRDISAILATLPEAPPT